MTPKIMKKVVATRLVDRKFIASKFCSEMTRFKLSTKYGRLSGFYRLIQEIKNCWIPNEYSGVQEMDLGGCSYEKKTSICGQIETKAFLTAFRIAGCPEWHNKSLIGVHRGRGGQAAMAPPHNQKEGGQSIWWPPPWDEIMKKMK